VCCRWAASAKIKHLTSNCSRRLRLSTDFLPVYRDPQIIATLSLSGCVCFERQLVADGAVWVPEMCGCAIMATRSSKFRLLGRLGRRQQRRHGRSFFLYFVYFVCVFWEKRSFYAPQISTKIRKERAFLILVLVWGA
jgi:hypothetical protein